MAVPTTQDSSFRELASPVLRNSRYREGIRRTKRRFDEMEMWTRNDLEPSSFLLASPISPNVILPSMQVLHDHPLHSYPYT